jgi:nitrogen fixation NifU-like protein
MPISIKDDPQMMREIILDHYQNPRNHREVSDPSYKEVHMASSSCIDDIYVQVKEENGIVVDCLWHGKGCVISTASTSIMTELVKGKTVKEAEYLMEQFQKMMNGEAFDENSLGEAIAFINTNRQPSRINCATIGWRGLKELFGDDDGCEEAKDGKKHE